MIEFPNGRHVCAMVAIAVMVVGCSAAPPMADSTDSGYYVVNPDGEVYTDGKGHCWHVTTRDKTESDKREECDQMAVMEKDSDGDGVPDSRDRCPNTPMGTQVDADGCPIEEQAPIVLKGVTFEFDSDRLTSQAETRLDNVVDALQASADLTFSIDGYTDSVGADAYNEDLSQRRVDSVKQYLIDQGISAARITSTQGHGESNPVASNDTAAGRAQNRRVELHVNQ